MQHTNGYIAQWLERLTADQQVPGSNPGVPLQCACVVPHTPSVCARVCIHTHLYPTRTVHMRDALHTLGHAFHAHIYTARTARMDDAGRVQLLPDCSHMGT